MILPRRSKGTPIGVELALVPARGHAHEEAPVRELVDARELLRQEHGVAQRQHEDAGAELDTARARCNCGQHGERFDDRKVRLDPEQHVIPDPERIVAELLSLYAVLDEAASIGHLRVCGEIARGNAVSAIETGHRLSPVEKAFRSSGVKAFGVELAQHCELLRGRRRGRAEVFGEVELESGVILHLLARNTGVERQHLHAPSSRPQSRRARDRSRPDACRQSGARVRARVSLPSMPPGARDEVDMSHKASLLVLHSDDHAGRDSRCRCPHRCPEGASSASRIADEGRVEVSELVDLGAAHEAHIYIAALEEKQHLSGAQHHIGALGAALVVGRGWKLPGLNEGTDHAALKQDRETGAIEPLRERGSEQRDTDAREHHLAVLQLARAENR